MSLKRTLKGKHASEMHALKGNHILERSLRPCHILPDSANGRAADSKILCPFVSIRMRFLSVPHAVNVFRVR